VRPVSATPTPATRRGLLNLGAALYLVADHREWFGRPAWAITLIGLGLAALAAGLTLDRAERRK
jgi:hypothetical protein